MLVWTERSMKSCFFLRSCSTAPCAHCVPSLRDTRPYAPTYIGTSMHSTTSGSSSPSVTATSSYSAASSTTKRTRRKVTSDQQAALDKSYDEVRISLCSVYAPVRPIFRHHVFLWGGCCGVRNRVRKPMHNPRPLLTRCGPLGHMYPVRG